MNNDRAIIYIFELK